MAYQTTSGLFFTVEEDCYISQSIHGGTGWEESLIKQVLPVFQTFGPDDQFLDVGAHIGSWTIGVSTLLGREVNTVAVEAQHEVFEKLTANITANNRQGTVNALNIAVGHLNDEEVSIEDRPRDGPNVNANWKIGSGIQANVGGIQLGVGSRRVTMRTLDSLMLDADAAITKPRFIKMDIEGSEPLALHGARKLLSTHKPVLFYEKNFKTVTDSMRQSMDLPQEVANFRVEDFAVEHGYHPVIHFCQDMYLLLPVGNLPTHFTPGKIVTPGNTILHLSANGTVTHDSGDHFGTLMRSDNIAYLTHGDLKFLGAITGSADCPTINWSNGTTWQFGVAPATHPDFAESTQPPREETIFITGNAKNVGSQLDAVIRNIERIGARFAQWRCSILYGESTDNTLAKLTTWANRCPNVEIVFIGHPEPQRTWRLAKLRNHALTKCSSSDLMLVLDLDDVNTRPIPVDSLTEALATAPADWAALTCKSLNDGAYYDMWALRWPGVCDGDCWVAVNNGGTERSCVMEPSAKARALLADATEPVKVGSAFNGLAIYNVAKIQACCRYNGKTSAGGEVCEHVAFHQCLASHGGGIYIHPLLQNGWP